MCDPGYACVGVGSIARGNKCQAGYYCKLGSPTETPPSKESGVPTDHGDACTAGFYCPEGSSQPLKWHSHARAQWECMRWASFN